MPMVYPHLFDEKDPPMDDLVLRTPPRLPPLRSRFPSAGFWACIQIIALVFLFAQGMIYKFHLEHEKIWSAELLDQNTHSLTIVAMQNKYINELETSINNHIQRLLEDK